MRKDKAPDLKGVRKRTGGRSTKVRMGPLQYVLKDAWRKRSRSILSMGGVAALSFLFVIFSSMDEGLDRYFEGRNDIGEPTAEEKTLNSLRDVMQDWTYLISVMCLILMILVVANTAAITVVERKVELATLRAVGLKGHQVYMMVLGSMFILVYGGVAAGTILGAASVPLLDQVEFAFWGDGIGFPMALDPIIILYVIGIGTISGILGMAPPLLLIRLSSPSEVLRNG